MPGTEHPAFRVRCQLCEPGLGRKGRAVSGRHSPDAGLVSFNGRSGPNSVAAVSPEWRGPRNPQAKINVGLGPTARLRPPGAASRIGAVTGFAAACSLDC